MPACQEPAFLRRCFLISSWWLFISCTMASKSKLAFSAPQGSNGFTADSILNTNRWVLVTFNRWHDCVRYIDLDTKDILILNISSRCILNTNRWVCVTSEIWFCDFDKNVGRRILWSIHWPLTSCCHISCPLAFFSECSTFCFDYHSNCVFHSKRKNLLKFLSKHRSPYWFWFATAFWGVLIPDGKAAHPSLLVLPFIRMGEEIPGFDSIKTDKKKSLKHLSPSRVTWNCSAMTHASVGPTFKMCTFGNEELV